VKPTTPRATPTSSRFANRVQALARSDSLLEGAELRQLGHEFRAVLRLERILILQLRGEQREDLGLDLEEALARGLERRHPVGGRDGEPPRRHRHDHVRVLVAMVARGRAGGKGWGCDSGRYAPWRSSPTDPIVWVASCIPASDGSGPFQASPVQWVPTIMDRMDAAGLSWRMYAPQVQDVGYIWATCPMFSASSASRT
jgi:hypothetical protein